MLIFTTLKSWSVKFNNKNVKYRNKKSLHSFSAQSSYSSWFALGCLTFSGLLSAQNAQQVKPEAATTSAPVPVQAPLESGPNALTRAMVQRGVLSCAARVEQVSRFLDFGPQVGAHLMPPPAPADQRLFSLQIELPAGAAGNSFVDMSFAPQQANGCGATYQTVTYWPQTCEAVGNQQFATFKPSQPLQRDVTVLNVGPMTKVFLMRAGATGCIAIKKEIVL